MNTDEAKTLVRGLTDKHFGPVKPLSDAEKALITKALMELSPMQRTIKSATEIARANGIDPSYRPIRQFYDEIFFKVLFPPIAHEPIKFF